MTPGTSAVVLSAGVTALVGAVGSLLLARLSRDRPAAAALGAPIVLVAALAVGVAVASRRMLIGDEDYRTLVFVLLAGAPIAVVAGLVLARRVSRTERDAARERADRERARAVEASRREMIRWLSHDLRTPLAGIRALAESLQAGAVADPAAAHQRIVREVDRMAAMVDDIAELSRLSGPAPTRPEPTALDDLVSDAVATVAPLADAAGVGVVATTLSGAVLDADARAVTRAVTNLVRNAVQRTPPGGRVEVGTTARPGGVAVTVSDECGGLPPADLERAFEPGWRADDSRPGGGMGLGLTIARAVARLHGGDAHLANRPSGGGCTATLTLPTSPRPRGTAG